MARNRVFVEGKYLSVTCSHPTTPLSGQPVRIGNITAVATTDERSDGTTSVDLGPAVYDLKVKGVDDAGNVAVAAGDPLYYVDADINDGTGFLSKKSSGTFFGFALEAVSSGATDAAARVLVVQGPGAGSGDIPAGTIAQADLVAASLDGTVAKVVADANVIGGIPVLHRIDIADAATGDVDVVLTHKTRVVEVWAVKTAANAAAANTFQVKNGANAITNALDMNVNDQTVVRAGTIDDAQHEIAAAGTLRVTRTRAGGNAAGIVYVLGIRVA